MALTRPKYSTIIDTDWKSSVRAATTGSNVTLSGGAPNTLDGVTLALNDRILVKDQSDPSQNGLYYVTTLGSGSNGTWTRTYDAAVSTSVTAGQVVPVTEGTANGGKIFLLSTPDPITLGTTGLTYVSASFNTSEINVLGNTNAATSTTSGALQVVGGVGIGGNIYVGANANILGNANVAGNLTVVGNLFVAGTSTTINNVSVTTTDATITVSSSASSAVISNGSGIIFGVGANLLYLNSPNALVANTSILTVNQLISNVTTGTAPLSVLSTTQVANLNAATSGTAVTVTAASQPNITSLGNLSNLTVRGGTGTYYAARFQGNTGGDQFAIGLSSTAGYGAANDILNSAGSAYAQYNLSASQITFNTGNITPTTALTISNVGVVTIAGNANVGNLGTAGLITATGNVTGGNLVTGGALSVTGNANVGNLGTAGLTTTGVTNLNSISNVKITGGSSGQYIQTDGAGNLSFSSGSTGIIANGNSNVSVISNGNINISSAGNANILVVTGVGANITGTLSVTGNSNIGNLNATGFISTSGNVVYGNLVQGGVIRSAILYANTATTPPASPKYGDQWYNQTNDVLYEYVTDGVSSFWLDTGSIPSSTGNIAASSATITSNLSSANVSVTNNLSVSNNATFTNNITIGGNVIRGGSRLNSTYFASPSAPANPILGDLWYYMSGDILYVRAYDGTNTFWLDLTTQSNNYATLTAGNLSVTGNITANTIISTVGSNANIYLDPDGTADVVLTNNTELFLLSTNANSIISSGGGSFAGNVTAGNLITNGNIYYANGTVFTSGGGSKPAVSYFWGQIF